MENLDTRHSVLDSEFLLSHRDLDPSKIYIQRHQISPSKTAGTVTIKDASEIDLGDQSGG